MMASVYFIIFTIVLTVTSVRGDITANSSCTLEMFGGDFNAYMACQTQFAHQSNWYPSPIAGLFTYQVCYITKTKTTAGGLLVPDGNPPLVVDNATWNGYDGFWEDGIVLETFANFDAFVGNNTRYKSVMKSSNRDLESLLLAYGPCPSFDDMAWYALSYARIYEVFGWDEFLKSSETIYNWLWKKGWDKTGTCGGGLWFNNGYYQKVTITNAEGIQAAGRLYRLTKNKKYLTQMHKIWNYVVQNGLVDPVSYLVHDGATENCTGNNFIGPTYLGGTIIGGLVEFYKIHKNQTYLDLANKVAKAAIANITNSSSIIKEYCEPNCNDDEKMFKGIFVRNIRYLMDELKDEKLRQEYQDFLDDNVKANLEYNMCDKQPIHLCNMTFKDGPPSFNVSGPVFSADWSGPFTYGAPMQQTATLDLLVAAIKPGTNCTGEYCNFDPTIPQPQPMTCDVHPCPETQPCCQYDNSFTCCTSDQKCIDGVCEEK